MEQYIIIDILPSTLVEVNYFLITQATFYYLHPTLTETVFSTNHSLVRARPSGADNGCLYPRTSTFRKTIQGPPVS